MKKQSKVEQKLYINRELSWLQFNERVLEEAADPAVPLFERLRFISIFMNNLDEFFMIRVGSLQDQMLMDPDFADNKTGMKISEQLDAVIKAVKTIVLKKDEVYRAMKHEIALYDIRRVRISELDGKDEAFVHGYFMHEIFPLLSPQIIDNRHPFPFLINKGIYVGVYFESHHDTHFGIIPAVGAFERVCFLPGAGIRFILVEDMIHQYADVLFGSYKIEDKMIFRITRNADIITDATLFDEDSDFRFTMKELLKKRTKLFPVRLEIQDELKKELIKYLCKKLMMDEDRTFITSTPLDLSFISKLEERIPKEQRRKMLFEPLVPQNSPMVAPDRLVLPQVLERDLLFSYPFESMKHFVAMLDEASKDSSVVSIKITLYRVGKESQIIQSLVNAAENGKDVTAVVELRARFDEEDNIEWATRMSEAGCRVIYGVLGYKVHSKVLLITRKIGKNIQYITQVGTGNYNERTARQYTDLSLVTSNPEIGMDAVAFFNDILVGNIAGSYKHILVAPSTMRNTILESIEAEIEEAKGGRPSSIHAKFNSLTDKSIIDKLIEASQAGVDIKLIIRGICCLRPGIPGKTDNITIISIVGRFLEHSRVYCFGSGERKKVYISSADWMTRNTERRIEVACPVLDTSLAQRIVNMLTTQLRDNIKARTLQASGSYSRIQPEAGDEMDSQIHFCQEAYTMTYELRQPEQQIKLEKKHKTGLFKIFAGKVLAK